MVYHVFFDGGGVKAVMVLMSFVRLTCDSYIVHSIKGGVQDIKNVTTKSESKSRKRN